MNIPNSAVKYDEIRVFGVRRADVRTLQQVNSLYESFGHSGIDLYHPVVTTFAARSGSSGILGAATIRHTITGVDDPQYVHVEWLETFTRRSEVVPALLRLIEWYGKDILEAPAITIDAIDRRQQEQLKTYGYVPTHFALASEKVL